MHICPQELMMIVFALPFLGSTLYWVRARFGKKTPVECCEHPHSHELPEAESREA